MRIANALSRLKGFGKRLVGRKSLEHYPHETEEAKKSKRLKLTNALEIMGYDDKRLAHEVKKVLGNRAWEYEGWLEIVEGKRNPEMKTEAREKLVKAIYDNRTSQL